MCGMRSFGSVPTCSGWGFSHIERFSPLRMTIREGGRALIKEAPRCRLSEGACVHMAAVQQRSLGCARDDDTGKCSFPIAFYSAARANLRPYGAPPSIGRRESRVPAPKLSRVRRKVMREYRFPVPSFRAQARNLFRSR